MQELSILRGMNIFDFPFASVTLWPNIRVSSAITQMIKSLLGHSLSNKMIIRVKKAFSVQICMLKNTLSVCNVIMKHYVCHHYLDCEN